MRKKAFLEAQLAANIVANYTTLKQSTADELQKEESPAAAATAAALIQ
jgi:hypothetical protein